MAGHLRPARPGPGRSGSDSGGRRRPGQLAQALVNAELLLASQGAGRTDVFKTLVFITDMGEYAAVNAAYTEFFGDHRPARSVVAVAGLPMGALVEVEVWANAPASAD